jgi:hypothetical protein
LRFYLFLFKGGGEAAGRKASGTRAELRCAGEKNAPAIYLITDLARARALAVILVPRQTQFLAFSGFLSLSLSLRVCDALWLDILLFLLYPNGSTSRPTYQQQTTRYAGAKRISLLSSFLLDPLGAHSSMIVLEHDYWLHLCFLLAFS